MCRPRHHRRTTIDHIGPAVNRTLGASSNGCLDSCDFDPRRETVTKRGLSVEEQMARRHAVRDLMPKTPYLAGLGVVIDRYEPDEATVRLPFRQDLTNDGSRYHGGVIAAVLDTAGAAAAWSNHDFDRGARASTVAMSVQYLGAAERSDLLCHARVTRRGRDLIFTEITATDATGAVVAHGIQTYRIV
jgi:uncharacterized protein (TIGR00369 family)